MKESGEMYLETILIESKIHANVRAVDVAARLGVTRPSASRALSKLREEDCILVNESGYITFTPKGLEIAEKIYERHNVLTALLVRAGVDEETAASDACKIEHVISDKTFEAIKRSQKCRT
ncbi:MAG: metal-dependent transcriptional regulator [Clostridia bacterium]|nr:metal-dependent transcriptional regulator [Clostridia bacterium]